MIFKIIGVAPVYKFNKVYTEVSVEDIGLAGTEVVVEDIAEAGIGAVGKGIEVGVEDIEAAAVVVEDILEVAVEDIVQVELKDNYCFAFFNRISKSKLIVFKKGSFQACVIEIF